MSTPRSEYPMIAPSGLIMLAEHLEFSALCMRCGAAQLNQETGPVQFMGAASPEVLAEEVQSAVPNERCSR